MAAVAERSPRHAKAPLSARPQQASRDRGREVHRHRDAAGSRPRRGPCMAMGAGRRDRARALGERPRDPAGCRCGCCGSPRRQQHWPLSISRQPARRAHWPAHDPEPPSRWPRGPEQTAAVIPATGRTPTASTAAVRPHRPCAAPSAPTCAGPARCRTGRCTGRTGRPASWSRRCVAWSADRMRCTRGCASRTPPPACGWFPGGPSTGSPRPMTAHRRAVRSGGLSQAAPGLSDRRPPPTSARTRLRSAPSGRPGCGRPPPGIRRKRSPAHPWTSTATPAPRRPRPAWSATRRPARPVAERPAPRRPGLRRAERPPRAHRAATRMQSAGEPGPRLGTTARATRRPMAGWTPGPTVPLAGRVEVPARGIPRTTATAAGVSVRRTRVSASPASRCCAVPRNRASRSTRGPRRTACRRWVRSAPPACSACTSDPDPHTAARAVTRASPGRVGSPVAPRSFLRAAGPTPRRCAGRRRPPPIPPPCCGLSRACRCRPARRWTPSSCVEPFRPPACPPGPPSIRPCCAAPSRPPRCRAPPRWTRRAAAGDRERRVAVGGIR